MLRKLMWITGAIAAALVLAPIRGMCSGDPWYNDLRRHWAEPYVRVLWEESVTDGYIPSVNPDVAKYWPEDYSTRAQFTTLLFKVFGLPAKCPDQPTYPDVPKSYLLFWNKPAWQFIEGAFYGGITFEPAGQPFRPDQFITREDSVELLVRSLDLDAYAGSLTAEQQESILGRFYDHHSVSAVRKASMACAVQLGIIKGYEDCSLRPGAYLARGEAATVVARSCLIRMASRKSVFSPDGDGMDDVAVFDLSYLKNRGISSWYAAVQDASGSQICSLGTGYGSPPSTLTWTGLTSTGGQAQVGRYYYQVLVTDYSHRQYLSVRRSLDLERHSLSAWLQPSTCRDGTWLVVSARTVHDAVSVTAVFAGGLQRSFRRVEPSYWECSLAVGPSLPAGTQPVRVTAHFGDAQRELQLSFTRTPDIWLDPSVVPNPATWGQRLQLLCRGPTNATSVEATLFGTSLQLALSNGTWQAPCTVPWGISPGAYPVIFTLKASGSTAQGTVNLSIRGPDTAGLTYVLTK